MRLITLLAFLSLIGMMVKIFMQDWIDEPKRNPILRFFELFKGGFGLYRFFPMEVKGSESERRKRIIANTFLLLFYVCFISLLIVMIFFSSD